MENKNLVNKNQAFLDLYKEWEFYLKHRFEKKDMYRNSLAFLNEEKERLQKDNIVKDDVMNILSVRNIVSHSKDFISIKDKCLVFTRRLVNNYCKKALDIATPGQKIYSVLPEDKLLTVIRKVRKNLYTHVPVIANNEFIGVFSENVLLKYIDDGGIINKETKIENVKKYLREQKGTDNFEFLPKTASFYDVYYLFQKYIDKGERLGVVFLSQKGRKTANILGLITAWDLHKGLDKIFKT